MYMVLRYNGNIPLLLINYINIDNRIKKYNLERLIKIVNKKNYDGYLKYKSEIDNKYKLNKTTKSILNMIGDELWLIRDWEW